MEVILMKDVPGLGAESDVVKVADGYARNYLLPQKLAAPVTEAARRRIEKRRAERAKEEEATLGDARKRAAAMEQASCTVTVKAGEEGKIFGSVTAAHVVEALSLQGIECDRHQIDLPEPLRELGVFTLPVRLHPRVTASLKVWVVEE